MIDKNQIITATIATSITIIIPEISIIIDDSNHNNYFDNNSNPSTNNNNGSCNSTVTITNQCHRHFENEKFHRNQFK